MAETRRHAELSSIVEGRDAKVWQDMGLGQEKRRGFFGFLTWPFILAQLLAAEQFIGGALRPAVADDQQGSLLGLNGSSDSNGAYETVPYNPRHRSDAEVQLEQVVAQPAALASAGDPPALPGRQSQFDVSGGPSVDFQP